MNEPGATDPSHGKQRIKSVGTKERLIKLTNEKYAEIELKHIQIELKNNRYQHLRNFIDQYFCYKNGYIKRTGNADWEGMVWNETVSLKAKNEPNRKKVVKEHVIPQKCVVCLCCTSNRIKTTRGIEKNNADRYR